MSNLKSDFGQFFHPIFTWGDTVPQPLMVATDHDGKSDVIVWKVPPSNEPATSKMEVGTYFYIYAIVSDIISS